jgi:periplasmic copper chaperone A
MKKVIQSVVLSVAVAAVSNLAMAQESVSDAWVRATVANQKATGMFANISSVQDGTRLVAASTDIAGVTQIHEMAMEEGIMRMREVPAGLPISKAQGLTLKPGGYHVMMMDLKRSPKLGEVVNVTLTFENAQGKRHDVQVAAEVRALNGSAAGAMKGHDMKEHDMKGHDMKGHGEKSH